MNEGTRAIIASISDELYSISIELANISNSESAPAIGTATQLSGIHKRIWKILSGKLQNCLTDLRQEAREAAKEQIRKDGALRKVMKEHDKALRDLKDK
jgi:hypothetical protein